MNKCWNPTMETMGREELRFIQLERLKATVERVYTNVPYYRDKMQRIGLLPGDIRTLEDLNKLPFTTKEDLRQTYPYGLFATPLENIIRTHASSGTTGMRTVVGYTKNDIDGWAECMARCLAMTGANRNSIIQVAYGYGLFTGGLGAHYGAERIGATVVPASAGNTPSQITIMKDFGVTALCCTPSYAIYLAETMAEAGLTKKDLKLEAGVFGAEPWSVNMRNEIESSLGIRAYDIYGLSEIMGPGVSQECECQDGLHIWEDYFIPEIIDPDTGANLPSNSLGELVFTTICKEGYPLLRYRTRDLSSLDTDKCQCGRHHARMHKPDGRSDDMLIIRGVNVFPSQIEHALLGIGEASPHYQIIVERVNNLDELTVMVEISESLFSDQVKDLATVEEKMKRQIQSEVGVSVKIRLVEPKSTQRTEGKAKRVIDKRNL